MPYKNPEDKLAQMKRWREQKIHGEGYGKWLYARRKLRFEAAERYQQELEHIASVVDDTGMSSEARLLEISRCVRESLEETTKAERALGGFPHQKLKKT